MKKIHNPNHVHARSCCNLFRLSLAIYNKPSATAMRMDSDADAHRHTESKRASRAEQEDRMDTSTSITCDLLLNGRHIFRALFCVLFFLGSLIIRSIHSSCLLLRFVICINEFFVRNYVEFLLQEGLTIFVCFKRFTLFYRGRPPPAPAPRPPPQTNKKPQKTCKSK